jgi:hypothetical protein
MNRPILPYSDADRTPDTAFRFGSKAIPISSLLFSLYSPQFSPGTPLEITGPVSEDSVVEFAKACSYTSYDITAENAADLLYLANAWQVKPVTDEVSRFILENPSILLHTLQYCVQNDIDSSPLEPYLRDNLALFLTDDRLLQLPVSLLARVVECAAWTGDANELLAFLTKALERYPAEASQLFRGFDFMAISQEKVDGLTRNTNFNWGIASAGIGRAVTRWVEKMDAEIAALKAGRGS